MWRGVLQYIIVEHKAISSMRVDLSVRFSKSSDKVFFCDMLVQLGTYKTITEAHDAIMLFTWVCGGVFYNISQPLPLLPPSS